MELGGKQDAPIEPVALTKEQMEQLVKDVQGKSLKDILGTLQGDLVKELLMRIRSGQAKPADLECARKMLADNDIQCLPEANPDFMKLAGKVLPFPAAGDSKEAM